MGGIFVGGIFVGGIFVGGIFGSRVGMANICIYICFIRAC